MRRYLNGILAFVSLGGIVSGGWVMAQSAPVKNIVLVHGAFADGSSWSKVIPLLQAKGYHVTSVAIPLTAFADDVAATKRAIAAEDGPVILVGHSYGGVVVTEAGNDPKVAGLGLRRCVCPRRKPEHHRDQQAFPSASRPKHGEATN